MIDALRTAWTKPRTVRGWVFGSVAALALVAAAIAFVAGLVAGAIAVPLGEHILRANGTVFDQMSAFTEPRVEVGAASLVADVAVAALGVLFVGAWTTLTLILAGVLLRRRDA